MIHAESPLTRRAARGFTLLEVLVVIGIIALLMGILIPTMGKARRQSKLTQCMSNLHQICMAMNAYSISNGGDYPDLTTPSTGGNLWDVSHSFTDAVMKQGVKLDEFICPLSIDGTAAKAAFNAYSTFNIIEYSVWIQRLNGTDLIPPSPSYTGSRFKIVQPVPTLSFAGPMNPSDVEGARNPIISDILGSNSGATPPATADASTAGNPYLLAGNSNHMDGLRLVDINVGFADGHVETRRAGEVQPYYMGNWWNWR